MGKRKAAGGKRTRRQLPAGQTARASGQTLKSWSVGALPIVNKILQRLKLEEFLRDGLPAEDRRTKVPTASALLVLLRNLLLSREPLYGIGEWAAGHAPDLLGLTPEQVAALNDDRVGRSLDRLFGCDTASLALTVVLVAGRSSLPAWSTEASLISTLRMSSHTTSTGVSLRSRPITLRHRLTMASELSTERIVQSSAVIPRRMDRVAAPREHPRS